MTPDEADQAMTEALAEGLIEVVVIGDDDPVDAYDHGDPITVRLRLLVVIAEAARDRGDHAELDALRALVAEVAEDLRGLADPRDL